MYVAAQNSEGIKEGSNKTKPFIKKGRPASNSRPRQRFFHRVTANSLAACQEEASTEKRERERLVFWREHKTHIAPPIGCVPLILYNNAQYVFASCAKAATSFRSGASAFILLADKMKTILYIYRAMYSAAPHHLPILSSRQTYRGAEQSVNPLSSTLASRDIISWPPNRVLILLLNQSQLILRARLLFFSSNIFPWRRAAAAIDKGDKRLCCCWTNKSAVRFDPHVCSCH